MTPKYLSIYDFAQRKSEEELKEIIVIDFVRQIRIRKKINSLFSNYDELSIFLESIKDGSFDSIDDLVLDYEKIIKTLYTNMMEENRGAAIEASASLDLTKDNFDSVTDLILSKYERKNTTPTGYDILDNIAFRGGFEPSRIYIIAGGSGAGKSTILNNFIVNAATTLQTTADGTEKSKEKNVYLLVTLENTIEESLLRIYQCLFNKSTTDVLRLIGKGVDIKAKLFKELDKTNSTIIIKYFPSTSISCLDLMSVLDDIITEYGEGALKGLYLDYLDLLRTDVKYDLYRLELGHITLSLKTIAVSYNIFVVAPTQLGRSIYRVKDSNSLNLDQMSESIKKVEHADVVCLLSKDNNKEGLVHFKVGKNRAGKSDISLNFSVNFNHYKFLTCTQVSNNEKPDSTTPSVSQFVGLSF
jgi:replicative DNA helicase